MLSAHPKPKELKVATTFSPVVIALAATDNGVAPEYPATTLDPSGKYVQTSPAISTGYAKYKKARAVKATFNTFIPVPPKASFAINTAKMVANATCQSGMFGGITKGISIPV